jgi:hypothetical protein
MPTDTHWDRLFTPDYTIDSNDSEIVQDIVNYMAAFALKGPTGVAERVLTDVAKALIMAGVRKVYTNTIMRVIMHAAIAKLHNKKSKSYQTFRTMGSCFMLAPVIFVCDGEQTSSWLPVYVAHQVGKLHVEIVMPGSMAKLAEAPTLYNVTLRGNQFVPPTADPGAIGQRYYMVNLND